MYIRETIGVIDRLPLPDSEREKIYWKNAVKLLKLPES
jgi:predicted TIM-barrel fold metal-dependent hydrolase